MHTEDVLSYLAYLERSCGGNDRHEFWSADNTPDIASARAFAEQIRTRLGGFLDDFVAVEQRVNVVKVHVVQPTEACTQAA